MTRVTPGWRRALAMLVIAHGLAHAVLPLRGSMAPDTFEHNSMPLILYGVAVLGFTTAGVGLFGVRPFTAVVRPLLVVGTAYSLVAIVTADQGELRWGVALDVVLLLIGVTGVYRRLPQGPNHPVPLFAQMKSIGWVILGETRGREVVFGAATQPWQANQVFRSIDSGNFEAFREPGYVKIAWSLRADPLDQHRTVFHTDTRVATTDADARQRFRHYWSFVAPGVELIRVAMLRPLKREAERRARLVAA